MKTGAVRDVFTHAHRAPDVVALQARTTVSIGGAGDPNAEDFQRAIGALFGVGFTLKFQRRAQGLSDFVVGPLEGEWTIEGPERPFLQIPRGDWRWTLRLTVPDDVTAEQVTAAMRAASRRRGSTPEAAKMIARVEREVVPPGRFGRVLHVGPYTEEERSFETLERYLTEHGDVRLKGHLEVYLSDPQRTAPNKLKTTLLVRLVDGKDQIGSP